MEKLFRKVRSYTALYLTFEDHRGNTIHDTSHSFQKIRKVTTVMNNVATTTAIFLFSASFSSFAGLFAKPVCLSFTVSLFLLFLAWFSRPSGFTNQRIEERKVLECAIKRCGIADAYNSNRRHKGFSINPRSDTTRGRPRFDYLVPGSSDFYVCSFIANSSAIRPLDETVVTFRPMLPSKRFHSTLPTIYFLDNLFLNFLFHSK